MIYLRWRFVVVERNQFPLVYVVKVVRLSTLDVGPARTYPECRAGWQLVVSILVLSDRRLAKGWDWRLHRFPRNAGPVCALSLVGKEVGWRK